MFRLLSFRMPRLEGPRQASGNSIILSRNIGAPFLIHSPAGEPAGRLRATVAADALSWGEPRVSTPDRNRDNFELPYPRTALGLNTPTCLQTALRAEESHFGQGVMDPLSPFTA